MSKDFRGAREREAHEQFTHIKIVKIKFLIQ